MWTWETIVEHLTLTTTHARKVWSDNAYALLKIISKIRVDKRFADLRPDLSHDNLVLVSTDHPERHIRIWSEDGITFQISCYTLQDPWVDNTIPQISEGDILDLLYEKIQDIEPE